MNSDLISRGNSYRLEGITVDQWAEETRQLLEVEHSIQWVIGRWIDQGCRHFGLTYPQAAQVIGCERSTVANYVRVVRAFPDDIERQRYKVDWTHYRTVCDLPAAEADELLALAEARSLSSRDLEREVRRRYPLPKPAKTASPATYRGSVTLTANDPDIIRQAVEYAEDTLDEWFSGYNGHIDITTVLPKPD
ncbi:MAG: hypothetical protein J2P16_00145 [Mycobacterium sp.]|nr:hypothetical protein [Mycobacterium sp.]